MKKKNLKSLKLNKKSISILRNDSIEGGGKIKTGNLSLDVATVCPSQALGCSPQTLGCPPQTLGCPPQTLGCPSQALGCLQTFGCLQTVQITVCG